MFGPCSSETLMATKPKHDMCRCDKDRMINTESYSEAPEAIIQRQRQHHHQYKSHPQRYQLVDALESLENVAPLHMFHDNNGNIWNQEGNNSNQARQLHHQPNNNNNTGLSREHPDDDTKMPAVATMEITNALGHGILPTSGTMAAMQGASETASPTNGNAKNHGSTRAGATKRKRGSKSNSGSSKDPNSTEKGHKRSYVEHHYHDHSQELEETQEDKAATKSRGGITTPFPMQLYDMLQHADTRGFNNIVSWQSHGRAFLVHQPQRFVKEVMPLFFRQTRMSSFQRQLSLYGFLRLSRKGPDHGAYYHELFLRGLPHLCRRMQRTRVKGYWVRQSSSPDTEPDFASMAVVGAPAKFDPSNLAMTGMPPQPRSAPTMPTVPPAASSATSATVPSASATSATAPSSVPNLNSSFSWLVGQSGNNNPNNNSNSEKVESSLSASQVGDFPPTGFMGTSSQLSSAILQNRVRVPPILGQPLPQPGVSSLLPGAGTPGGSPLLPHLGGAAPQLAQAAAAQIAVAQLAAAQQASVAAAAAAAAAATAPAPNSTGTGNSGRFDLLHMNQPQPLSSPLSEAPSPVASPQNVEPTDSQSPQPYAVAANHTSSSEDRLMAMSAGEVNDMVAFLSDVDLSGDENSVGESFEEEAKIAMVGSIQPSTNNNNTTSGNPSFRQTKRRKSDG